MVQLTRHEAMTAAMARQENDFASRQFSREKFIGWRTERRLDLDPFLMGKALDMIQATAADNSDSVIRHPAFIATSFRKVADKLLGQAFQNGALPIKSEADEFRS